MTMLEICNISKNFSGFQAVSDFSLKVNKGELRCLLGPNGAGKSTCMDLITGRQKPTAGAILFEGREISRLAEHEIVRRGIGRKFQVPAVFKELSVRENLEVAFSRARGPFANMGILPRSNRNRRFKEIVEIVALGDRLDVQAGLLAHGETQWLEIGMVLMQDPRLLLMDEPTAGMTEQETHKTSEIFNTLKGEHTLIVVEHDMSFVREISDVVTVMHRGSLLAEGTIEKIEKDPKVKEVYLGTGGVH